MSTLDEIRARNDNQMRMGHRFAPGSVIDDRRTLLALLDAQSLELAAIESSNQCLRTAIAGDDQMLDALRAELSAQSLELQAVREALRALLHTPAVIDALNPGGSPHVGRCECPWCAGHAALKQSRGA